MNVAISRKNLLVNAQIWNLHSAINKRKWTKNLKTVSVYTRDRSRFKISDWASKLSTVFFLEWMNSDIPRRLHKIGPSSTYNLMLCKGQQISEWIYKASFLPKYRQKIAKISALCSEGRKQGRNSDNFCSYVGRNDDFINSFWN